MTFFQKYIIMKKTFMIIVISLLAFEGYSQTAGSKEYLKPVISELLKKWPDNKTVNIIFHGHSVPSGYFVTPGVNTLAAYPYQTLTRIKKEYKNAVVNTITTSIGGEQSEQGQLRFEKEVLCMRPDVLFIDYALNDRAIGLEKARDAWVKMIEAALAYGCKVILMTPTPDTGEDILDEDSPLAQHARQIRDLAATYRVGLVDSYKTFRNMKASGMDLNNYMAQSNHINEAGHKIVANEIWKWFINNIPR